MSETTAWWGASTGTLALLVSVYNAIQARRQALVRLEVVPEMRSYAKAGYSVTFLVRIINRSTFELKIDSAGIVVVDDQGEQSIIYMDGEPYELPMTMDARSSMSLPVHGLRSAIQFAALGVFDHVYVKTSQGDHLRSPRDHPFVGKTLKQLQDDSSYWTQD